MKCLSLLLLTMMLFSCAKDKAYKELLKEDVVSKSLIEEGEYLYLPSVGNTPKNITASRPYWQGDERLVKFKFTKDTLDAVEVELDERFQGNDNNSLPVLSFDIDHVGYQCAKDDYNDCTNKEEESEDVPLKARGHFKLKGLKNENNSTLPIALTNLFSSCFSVIDSKIIEAKFEKNFINFTVRKTYSAGLDCADIKSFDDIKNSKFSVDYKHSFAKLDAISSKDYEKVNYPYSDTNKFGFFTTSYKKVDVDNSTNSDSDHVFLNRFNPKKKEVAYYLSADFYKPELKSILDATYEGIKRVNESFTEAGLDMKIVLKDGRDLPIGDIRYNFLILVTDPQASGVIGYGPAATNPRTGEIINARTVMYYGTMLKFVSRTYDDIVKELNEKESSKTLKKEPKQEEKKYSAAEIEEQKIYPAHKAHNHLKKMHHHHFHGAVHFKKRAHTSILPQKFTQKRVKEHIFDVNRKMDFSRIDKEDPTKHIEEMSRHNVYHGSLFNFHSAVKTGLKGKKKLKLWDELTQKEKKEKLKELMPFVWVPTLVHEFGHNLGLRHNFNGSEDKENFYNSQERVIMGLNKKVEYSSVMDYPYSELNSLPKMGKYDIAAIRFGYKREVETTTGDIIKVEGPLYDDQGNLSQKMGAKLAQLNLVRRVRLDKAQKEMASLTQQMSSVNKEEKKLVLKAKKELLEKKIKKIQEEEVKLKSYRFCTDEHVSVNPGCNRFDEGTSLTGIVDHYINSYEKSYKRHNFRGNRDNFDIYFGEYRYFMMKYGQFRTMRLVFEIYDRIKQTYPDLADADWDKYPFLKDLKTATNKVSDFFVKVIKTPGLNCMLIKRETMQLQGVFSINDPQLKSEGRLANCFESEMLQNYAGQQGLLVGQFGKRINSAKSKFMKDKYRPDPTEVSVRGVAIDKVLAMHFLTRRNMRSPIFNDSLLNFLDYPAFAQKISMTLLGIFTDEMTAKTDITIKNGSEMVTIKDQEVSFKFSGGSYIDRPYIAPIASFMEATDHENDLKRIFIKKLKRELVSEGSPASASEMMELFSVAKLGKRDRYRNKVYDRDGLIGWKRYGIFKENALGIILSDMHSFNGAVQGLERNNLIALFQARSENKPAPEGMDQKYQRVWNLITKKKVKLYIDGVEQETEVDNNPDLMLNNLYKHLTVGLPGEKFLVDAMDALASY